MAGLTLSVFGTMSQQFAKMQINKVPVFLGVGQDVLSKKIFNGFIKIK
jgi:hypothetical protein